MHIEKARIYGCTIYWNGKSLCVHHPREAGHHLVSSYAEAMSLAKKIGGRYPAEIVEEDIEEPIIQN